MNSGYNIPPVTSACEIDRDAIAINRSEQIEDIPDFTKTDISAARDFYSKNHVTQGMSELLRGALKRLSGKSPQAVFKLQQAMGGGKTHNMTALGFLAKFPELKDVLPADITDGTGGETAKIAIVNGRSVEKFICGDIAEQVGKAEEFRDHWVNGPREMNEKEWMRLIGDEPTLIMLDELPAYLDLASAKTVGKESLLEILKYTLANLFSAATKCKRCVVVIASLDAAYNSARHHLNVILADLKKELGRGAKSITPVDLSTDEIYDILRKRLFTNIPDRDGDEVGRVAQAYLAAYKEGVKGNALEKSAEQMADEIVGSYPFHPSYKNIVSLFKENEKFRQTRDLIQFTANLLRGILSNKDDEVFLVGAQHLDFSDRGTRDHLREIEKSLDVALTSDVYDANGSSHAQEIDASTGDRSASQVAALLFVSSLSDNVDGIRGLPRDRVIEYLVAPGSSPAVFINVFDELRKKCWYLHNKDEDRWYFSDVANVLKLIEEKAKKIDSTRVDDEMRRRLTDIFRPVTKTAYTDVATLPKVSDVNLTPSKRFCLVFSPDAKSPPKAAAQFFADAVYKNAFCVVSGDGSRMGDAEKIVRRLLAIAAVKERVKDTPRHMEEIKAERNTAEMEFNSAVKTLFNAVWYPHKKELKRARIDLGQHEENGNIQGELVVEGALKGMDALKIGEFSDDKIDGLIRRCEDQLFHDRQSRIRWSDVLDRAASIPEWIWLPPGGMERIRVTALEQGRWAEDNGTVDKNPPPPRPVIRATGEAKSEATSESEIELNVSNAGKSHEIRVAATKDKVGVGEVVTGTIHNTMEVERWFQVKNLETGETSEPEHWKGTIRIKYERREIAGAWEVELTSIPEAELRWNTTGITPKTGKIYDGNPIEIDGKKSATLFVHAKKGTVSEEKRFDLHAVGAEKKIDDNLPVKVNKDFQFATKEEVMKIIGFSRIREDIKFKGVSVTAGKGSNVLKVRAIGKISITGHGIEALVNGLRTALGNMDAELQLRFDEVDFPDGITMREFATQTGQSIPQAHIEQES